MAELKLALIGCGRISQQHYNGIRVVCGGARARMAARCGRDGAAYPVEHAAVARREGEQRRPTCRPVALAATSFKDFGWFRSAKLSAKLGLEAHAWRYL